MMQAFSGTAITPETKVLRQLEACGSVREDGITAWQMAGSHEDSAALDFLGQYAGDDSSSVARQRSQLRVHKHVEQCLEALQEQRRELQGLAMPADPLPETSPFPGYNRLRELRIEPEGNWAGGAASKDMMQRLDRGESEVDDQGVALFHHSDMSLYTTRTFKKQLVRDPPEQFRPHVGRVLLELRARGAVTDLGLGVAPNSLQAWPKIPVEGALQEDRRHMPATSMIELANSINNEMVKAERESEELRAAQEEMKARADVHHTSAIEHAEALSRNLSELREERAATLEAMQQRMGLANSEVLCAKAWTAASEDDRLAACEVLVELRQEEEREAEERMRAEELAEQADQVRTIDLEATQEPTSYGDEGLKEQGPDGRPRTSRLLVGDGLVVEGSDMREEELADVQHWMIQVDRRLGRALGIEMGVQEGWSSIRIDHVEELGLIPEWNKRYPDEPVHAGDRITEVNGFSGSAGILYMELAKLEVLKIACSRDPVLRWEVDIDRSSGRPLGIAVRARLGGVLEILELAGGGFDSIAGREPVADSSRTVSECRCCRGLISAWNEKVEEKLFVVARGDRIEQVNGKSGDFDVLASELLAHAPAKLSMTRLTLRRGGTRWDADHLASFRRRARPKRAPRKRQEQDEAPQEGGDCNNQ